MEVSWWTYLLIAIAVFLILLVAHYLVKKYNEIKLEEKYMQLYKKNSTSTQVQAPLIDMEVKRSSSKTKKEDESFKGISLVFSKTKQHVPRLSASATTWASEENKMKCIFNKGIAFCSNDTIRHNLSNEIKVQGSISKSSFISSSKTILTQNFDVPSDNQIPELYLVKDNLNKSKTQFAADIYSLVKSSSNIVILEEMKANENIYNLHLGAIYTQTTDDSNLANESLQLNNVIKNSECSIDNPKTIPLKIEKDDENRFEEQVIEMEDIKNKFNTTDLGPGVLTVAIIDELSDETIKEDEAADNVSVIEPTRIFRDDIKVSIEVKDSTGSPTIFTSTDEFNFAKSIAEPCDTLERKETSGTRSPFQDIAKITFPTPFSRDLPKALSVIEETGYSDVTFSDSVLKPTSESTLELKRSDSAKLVSSDPGINRRTLYRLRHEPEASTSTRFFKSFLYSEDDTIITFEKNDIVENEDKQPIESFKISESIENENNNFQCEPL